VLPTSLPTATTGNPLRSMTGFASVRSETAAGELTFSLRSVNGRNLDLHFHSGSEYAIFENALRTLLKRELGRGHVEIRMSFTAGSTAAAGFNSELLAKYLSGFRAASKEFRLQAEPDLNCLLALPGIFEGVAQPSVADLAEGEVLAAAENCVNHLNRFREREGAELGKAIGTELAAIGHGARQMLAIRLRATNELRERLEERLGALLNNSEIPQSRLIEEAAILADRSDIQEEITRLEIHSVELGRMLSAGGEVGKRLDFLLQEMNRETNTILSKTSGVGDTGVTITNIGIGIKANIERIREQALNLE
jgi:uncharacterized protein (TIGR00255 family)